MNEQEWIDILTDDASPADSRRRVLEEMRACLLIGDPNERGRVIRVIKEVGRAAVELREDLLQVWQGPDRATHLYPLVHAFGRIGDVSTLVEALEPPDCPSGLRRSIPGALRSLGPAATAAAPALVKILGDDEKRGESIEALTAIGSAAVPALLTGLKADSDMLRGRALRVLGFIGHAAHAAIPAAIRALDDPHPRVRTQAVFALGNIGSLPEEAILGLARSVADENSRVRHEALLALRELGRAAAAATPALVSRLSGTDWDDLWDDDEEDELIETIEALGAIGSATDEAAATMLRTILTNEEAPFACRCAAALALWRVGGDAGKAATALRELAKDGLPRSLRAKLDAGEVPAVIVENLQRIAGGKRRVARQTLFRMGATAGDCTELIRAGLQDEDNEGRVETIRAVPTVVADRESIVPILLTLVEDPDGDTRWQTIQSLLRLGVVDPRIGESMKFAMQHGAWESGPCSWDDGRCAEAVDLIGALGPDAAALAATLEHLRDHYPSLRPRVAVALAGVRGNVAAAVPELIALLAGTEAPCPAQSAARCLGQIGPAAQEAVPALRRLARYDSNSYNREAALGALQRIDPGAAAAVRKIFC